MKWYQEKTYKAAMIGMTAMAIFFTVGNTIVDRQFHPEALMLFGGVVLIMTIISYVKRNG